jgi:hypothetical protein
MSVGMIVLTVLMVLNTTPRGTKTAPPRLDANKYDYLAEGEEYAYIFRNGEWVCYNRNEFGSQIPEIVEIPSGALAV